ncbi:MAG TPA: ATP-binding protein [bacterium]|nr:ATP-binding protein [bacterium]
MLTRVKDLQRLKDLMRQFPVTAILGARQCGKTTLSRQVDGAHYFDLENPRDLARLDNPQTVLETLEGLIVIDEIQRRPDLFPLLRHLVDTRQQQRYLILGSASRDLVVRSSESLAGRIGYHYLDGFSLADVGGEFWRALLLRGGYPRSYLAENDDRSLEWRNQYITTFLERDIPQLGIAIPAPTLRRFWMMLSHYHGQTMNYSELARSFGISDATVRRYLDILVGTFMVRLLMPWHTNTSKRLVKAPKLYLRDSGIFHALQSIGTEAELFGHPKLGASWEGFALEQTVRALDKSDGEIFFWAVHGGAEVDLFWQSGGRNYGAECKFMDAPVLTRSMQTAVKELSLERLYVIYPGSQRYVLHERIEVLPVSVVWEELAKK